MVKTEFFTHEHYPEVCAWFNAHTMTAPGIHFLPTNGVIVPGIAAGFLYLTDSPICILDCFISSPKTNREERGEAIDAIVERLCTLAKAHGSKLIICDTKYSSLRDRAVKLGFSLMGTQFALSKEIQ